MYETRDVSEIMFEVVFAGVPIQIVALTFMIVWGCVFAFTLYKCYNFFKGNPAMTIEETIWFWAIICVSPFLSFFVTLAGCIVLYIILLMILGALGWFKILITALF